jgi:hypothetical protein
MRQWQSIATAPFDHDLELAVINYDVTHPLVFPCRRIAGGWIDAKTKTRLTIFPTHRREWQPSRSVRERGRDPLPLR